MEFDIELDPMQSIAAQQLLAVNANQPLPVSELDICEIFKQQLNRAFLYDYGQKPLVFGNKTIR